MNIYTKEQIVSIMTIVMQKIKASQAFTINKRNGLPFEDWIGTQAEYDAIPTKDPNTRYWITE